MIDELDLVTGLRPEVQPPTSEARRAARAALQHTIANDRHADADADRRVTGVRPSRRLAQRRLLADPARDRASRRPSLGGLATAALIALTVAIAAGALIVLGGHKPSVSASANRGSSRQQLIDILGILRRPQTQADLGLPHDTLFPNRLRAALNGEPDLPLVRLAAATPWGKQVFFIPMKPPVRRHNPVRRGNERAGAGYLRLRRTETLDIRIGPVRLSHGRAELRFSGNGGLTASQIEAGDAWFPFDPGPPPKPGTTTETRLIVVVPDGVARVAFVFARQGWPQTRVYAHPQVIGVRVRDNIAAVQTDRPCCYESGPIMIWRRPDGTVIKRIGDLAAAYRVHLPGPETPLSRAAERDPSTPNPLSVQPPDGGPTTTFFAQFRVLLNYAGYRYTVSGPNKTGCFGAHELGGGGGGGYDDLRGEPFRVHIGGGPGENLCPGTYHFNATVTSVGRRILRHPRRPFGTATFTVNR